MIVDKHPEYLKIDADKMNEFTKDDKTYDFFNKYVPKLLKSWSNYIEIKTNEMKKDGATEEQVKAALEYLEPHEQMNFDFYVISK